MIPVMINPARAQETPENREFRKIIVSGKILVQVNRSDHFLVEIKPEEITEKCLVYEIKQGTLTLKLLGSASCKSKATVNISCPYLDEIEVSGRAEIAFGNVLQGDSMFVKVSTGAKAYLDLDVKYLQLRLSEGGMARLEGYANEQLISGFTNSVCSAWELEGEEVEVNVASNAIAKVNAQQRIRATAGSGGYIGIKGDPEEKDIDPKSYGQIEFLDE